MCIIKCIIKESKPYIVVHSLNKLLPWYSNMLHCKCICTAFMNTTIIFTCMMTTCLMCNNIKLWLQFHWRLSVMLSQCPISCASEIFHVFSPVLFQQSLRYLSLLFFACLANNKKIALWNRALLPLKNGYLWLSSAPATYTRLCTYCAHIVQACSSCINV